MADSKAYIKEVLDLVVKRDPDQPQFLHTATKVLESVESTPQARCWNPLNRCSPSIPNTRQTKSLSAW